MRLLRTDTLALELFPDDRHIPPYAVLSHTWGAEEVTFQEMQGPADAYRHKEGFKKMKGCCRRALRDGLAYVWVDTCCIDKTSSAELSEAINSMFRWYEMSRACYVHLADVPADGGRQADIYQDVFAAYRACRWFTRGWTLQELLAPADVQFFDAGWNYIGSKSKNMAAIEKITGIRSRFLRSAARRSDASVAQRMSWAAGRQTTRREDRAYCLLGIFGINMPLLYGEGDRAFVRLQEEIMRESDDQSLFAWGLGLPLDGSDDDDDDDGAGDEDGRNEGGLFARSPDAFRNCAGINLWGQLSTQRPTHYFSTNKGLRIELPLIAPADGDSDTVYAVLDCIHDMRFVALPLSRAYHDDVYQRTRGSAPRAVSVTMRQRAVWRVVYVQKHPAGSSVTSYLGHSRIATEALRQREYRLVDAYPPHAVLKADRRGITWGDALQVLLLFRETTDEDGPTLALLATASYRPKEHDLARPVLEGVRCQFARGPRPGRFARLVLDAPDGSSGGGLGRTLQFEDTAAIGGGDVVSTTVRAKAPTGWTVSIDVAASPSPPPPQPLPPTSSFLLSLRRREKSLLQQQLSDGSDSDGFERISIDALAAMANNSNRDFRQRQAWIRWQKRPRRTWVTASALAAGIAPLFLALYCFVDWDAALQVLDLGLWSRVGTTAEDPYLSYSTIGIAVVSSCVLVLWWDFGG